MPIRPDLRKFYGKEWREVIRPRILARAGNRCEACGVPNHTRVTRAMGWWMIPPDMWWFYPWKPDQFPEIIWRNEGAAIHKGDNFPREICHEVYIVITVAHLNHVSGDDRDENLKALCQYHHLAMDVFQHKATRATRKDAARPLLVSA